MKKNKSPVPPTSMEGKPNNCSAFQLKHNNVILCNRVGPCCRFFNGLLELYKKKHPEHFNEQGDFIG